MENLFHKIFTSDQFTFFVGKGKKPIVVHAAAIADQSPALNALINGRMVEAQARSVIFDDVLEEDFIRFCQFAYTGDYTPPPGIIKDDASHLHGQSSLESDSEPEQSDAIPPPPEEPPPEEPAADEPAVEEPAAEEPVAKPEYYWGNYSQTHHHRSKASKKVNLRRSFDNKLICPTLPRQRIINSCEAIPNSNVNEDYTGVFLAHARLYVFADKYGIEPLESLSLHKLHKTLKSFTLYRARIGDVLKLARYAYENTLDDEHNKLRVLVCEYIACEIDTIGSTKRFLALMEEGGLFVRDFWKLVQHCI